MYNIEQCEVNKCLYIIRGLRKEGYSQDKNDLLFKAIVLSKITYGLPVDGASEADLNVIQYTYEMLDIRQSLEKVIRNSSKKISTDSCHPLHSLLPRVKANKAKM